MTIVIIDDDGDEIDFMKAALEASYPDATCIAFGDCENALSALQVISFCPEYIFLDVNMKKMDGEECLEVLHSYQNLCNSKIVMMSASMRMYQQLEQRFLEKGAFTIAEKPNDMDSYGKMFSGIIG